MPPTSCSGAACAWGGRPLTVTEPLVGSSRPRIIRIVVDFPAPFGPRKPVTVPGRTVNVRSETAVVGPYRLVSSWISIMKSTLPNGRVPVIGAPSLPRLGAVPAGLAGGLLAVLFPVAPWLARWFTETDEGLARALLGPGRRESLAQRVETLARSRADVVAAADAERRRIERDLHDGAQQRLVSLAMNLGMARERFEAEPEPVRQALAAAHDEAVLALTELREFIRGLHPAVLNDRGLDAALSGLAARAPLPVRLRVDMPKPAAPGVEAVAYFIVSDAITNVVKHAQATRAEVAVTRVGDVLRIAVTDDGRGGAS